MAEENVPFRVLQELVWISASALILRASLRGADAGFGGMDFDAGTGALFATHRSITTNGQRLGGGFVFYADQLAV